MTDVSITAANVQKEAGTGFSEGVAGASVTAGQVLYEDATDSHKLKLADANASQATSRAVGIALHAAAAGQPLKYLREGPITIGATLVVGQVYIVSATPGGIAPVSDLATGWFTGILGIAIDADTLYVDITTPGIAKA